MSGSLLSSASPPAHALSLSQINKIKNIIVKLEPAAGKLTWYNFTLGLVWTKPDFGN